MNHVDLPGCDDFLVHRMSLAEQLIRFRGLVVLFVAGLQLVAWPFLCTSSIEVLEKEPGRRVAHSFCFTSASLGSESSHSSHCSMTLSRKSAQNGGRLES